MTFEAHYSKSRLLGLAALALLFILFGLWIITRDAAFLSDPRGRSAGVMCSVRSRPCRFTTG